MTGVFLPEMDRGTETTGGIADIELDCLVALLAFLQPLDEPLIITSGFEQYSRHQETTDANGMCLATGDEGTADSDSPVGGCRLAENLENTFTCRLADKSQSITTGR